MKQLSVFLIGLLLGAAGIYVYFQKFKPIVPTPISNLAKIKIDTVAPFFKYFGTEIGKGEAINFSNEYLGYLKKMEPAEGNFNKVYTASTYFSLTEIATFMSLIIQRNPNVKVENIRMHFCNTKYPINTINPVNNKPVGERLGGCIAFFDAGQFNPYAERPGPGNRIVYEANTFLGAYNWGDLMP